jgi:Holliday junction resolvase
MVNSKTKGSSAERELVKVLNNTIDGGQFSRVYASGSVGTTLGISTLMGDINGKVPGFSKPFKIEAKSGYSNVKNKEAKSLSVKKEWLDKIKEEAKAAYAIPMLIGKFDGVHSGVKYFVCLDMETFAEIINEYSELKRELDLVYEKESKNELLGSNSESL